MWKSIEKDGYPKPNRYKELLVTNGKTILLLAYDGIHIKMPSLTSIVEEVFEEKDPEEPRKYHQWLKLGAGRHGMDLVVKADNITHYLDPKELISMIDNNPNDIDGAGS